MNINPYETTWIEFRAVKGIVTKKDEKNLRRYGILVNGKNKKTIYEQFASKDDAEDFVKNIEKSKLSKNYEARLFTDAQFAHAEVKNGVVNVIFTKKQNDNMFLL